VVAVEKLSADLGSAGNSGEGDLLAGAVELGECATRAGLGLAGALSGSVGEVR
jgi:hypothetical protein